MTEYKVIFHIDENLKWDLLLGNVKNLIEAKNINIFDIEVLANSEAVKNYVSDQDTDAHTIKMRELNQKGVQFVACNNALKGFNISKDSLLDFVVVVPAGVMELVIKQSEGYHYIKP